MALARGAAAAAITLLPAILVINLGFSAGGFFPRQQDLASALLALLLAVTVAVGTGASGARNRPLQVVSLCFAAYAAWVLLSLTWSHAPLRATREFSLTLLYLMAFVLYGRSTSSAQRLRWLVRGIALGCFAVCLVALVSRTLPAVWPIASSSDTPRLSYPVSYWNALGLLAALGAILSVSLSGDDAEPTPLKALSALAVPVFAATLLLTLSRGAIGAGAVGMVALVLLARSRSLPGALLSIGPPTAVAFAAAYAADALARPSANNPAAVGQGHHVALVVVLASLAAGALRVLFTALDRRLIAATWRAPGSGRDRRLAAAIALVVAVVVALAAGAPHAVRQQYHNFVNGNALPAYAQPRDRLTSTGADGRIDLWRVSAAQYRSDPLRGTGAGTFELAWREQRPRYEQVVNAHSLYAENLGNLGIVGLGLLGVVVLASLAALAVRVRRASERALYAGAFAATLAWAIHAGIDWDWQMPVVTLPIFALAGAGFAAGRAAGPGPVGAVASPRAPRRAFARAPACLVALALAALLLIAARSESRISTSLAAFEHNDCAAATSAARASLSPLSFRPDAHEVLGYCEAAAGQSAAAVGDMRRAVAEDPGNWETHYGLSIVLAAAGRDPRAEMARARALDPKNAVPLVAATFFRYALRSYWPQESAVDLIQIDRQGDRNLDDLRPRPATARR